ncbi:DUF4297 domain-containing protein [Octadecabacter sp. CECT 8868]|uniref:dsDNA nuclease domain-containing protein n=1 Tax=Octadecabacter algicola TaxID=2909342 RepID=UPI001F46CD4E|nr:dsDNA nuclease domain-containing protein [Octadecabacter algicola]MCF2904641.1 DUF4297 domain-containing protein [Octadecabacter algicola]
MSDLKEKLVQTPLREDSGARTTARFRYQALFGMALILERHVLDGDYAVVFEFHDDVAVFNSSSEPTSVRFYQVKTKGSGEWTHASLTGQRKSKKSDSMLPSIIGKMYDNVVAFGDTVEATTFVSNAPMKFSQNKAKFCLEECTVDDLGKLKAKLEAQFPNESVIRTDLIHFRRSDLSLEDMDTHAKGKLEAFVAAQLGEVSFSVSALFTAVADECTRKSRATSELSDFDEVVRDRGVTRNDAENWIATVSEVVDCPNWEVIAPQLTLPVLEVVKIGRHWGAYRVEVLNPNEATRRVRRKISKLLDEEQYQLLGLTDLVDQVNGSVAEYAQQELALISTERIKAMVLYETYTNKEA